MRTLTITLFLTLALALPAAAEAQVYAPGPYAAPGRGAKLRKKIAKRIRLMRMNAIITALNLSTTQAPKFFAVVNQFEKKLRKVRQANRKIMRQLHTMVSSNNYKAKKINQLAAQLMKNQIKVKQIELKRFGAIKKVITAKQLAKLLIAMPRIERRIRRLIRRAQRRHRGSHWKNAGP